MEPTQTSGDRDPLPGTIADQPASSSPEVSGTFEATVHSSTNPGGPRVVQDTTDGSGPDGPRVVARREPTVVGYEILGELGRGSMGVVYKARRIGLDRECALKMILAGAHADSVGSIRFRAEAQTVARLQHPNVVQIHHIGEAEGLPFFELEYVPGGSLDRQLDGTPWPAKKAAELVEALTRGVAEAHSLDIIHRDLKPGNILMTARGLPKIADFGLAKSIQEGDSGLTATESILGTPNYMAPEQAGGRNRDVGKAADVYSLGVILYELLTGRPPFRGATILATLEQVKTAEPVAPSRLVPGVPRDLETIALACLRKEPERRYPSAAALAEDLRRFLGGETILARRSGPWRRSWRWARRNPALAGSLAALAAVLVVGFAGMAALWSKAEDNAEDARRLARSETATRAESDRLSANLALDKGIGLAIGGQVGPGLAWMAESLKRAPGDDQGRGLKRAALANLSAWRGSMIEPRAILHQPAPILGMAVSPDGRVAATGASDGAIRFWDLARARPLGEPIPAHRVEPIHHHFGLIFRPDGKALASFGEDGVARLWDVAARKPIGAPMSHRRPDPPPRFESPVAWDWVSAAAFSPDGKVFATAGNDGLARLHDAETGRDLGAPMVLDTLCRSVAFSPDGKILLTGGVDQAGRLWDGRTGVPLGPPVAVQAPIHAVAFSPDGARFALGCYGKENPKKSGGARVFDSATRREVASIVPDGDDRLVLLRFRPDGKALLTAAFSGEVRQWGLDDGREIGAAMRHDEAIVDARHGPDGRSILTGSEDGTARLWEAETGRLLGSIMEHGGIVRKVEYSPDGRSLITASADATLRTWDASNVLGPGRSLPYTPYPPKPNAAFSPDGKLLATASHDGSARIWEVASGLPVGPPLLHGGALVRAVRFRPDGKVLATGGDDRTIRLWDAADGKPVGTPMAMEHWVLALEFSPDGSRLLAGRVEGQARLWDPETCRQVGPPMDHPSHAQGHEVWVVGFTPDGRTAITGGSDGTVGVWDAAPGARRGEFARFPNGIRQILPLPGGRSALVLESEQVRVVDLDNPSADGPSFGRRVLFMAVSPDGRTVLTGERDRVARLWDLATRQTIGPLMEHPDSVITVSFSPDGKTLATGTAGALRFWDSATSKPIGAPLEDARLFDDRRLNDSRVPFSPDGRLVAGIGSRITLWPVPTALDEPADRLAASTLLLGGMQLDDRGGIRPTDPSRWQAEKEALIGPGPAGPAISAAEWHDRVASDCLSRGPYWAGLWHLDRLIALRPDDWTLFARRSTVRTRLGDHAAARLDEDLAYSHGPADRVRDWFRHMAPKPAAGGPPVGNATP